MFHPSVAVDFASLYGKPIGELPEIANIVWDSQYVDFFNHCRYKDSYNALSQPDFTPTRDPVDGTLRSNYSHKEWKARSKVLNAKLPDEPETKSGPFPHILHTDHVISDEESDIDIRVYHPTETNTKSISTTAYLYGHGGGMYAGTEGSGDDICSRVVDFYNMPAVSYGYRKGPNHKFPGGHDDATKVLKWAQEHLMSTCLGKNVNRIESAGGPTQIDSHPTQIDDFVLGGISSGMGLALSTAIAAIKEDQAQSASRPDTEASKQAIPIKIRGIVGSVPVCSVAPDDYDTATWREHRNNPIMSSIALMWMSLQYARTLADLTDPRWSFLHEDSEVLGKLPPITIFTAELDPLREAAREFASRVIEAGGKVTLGEYKGLPHPAPGLDNICDEARRVNTLSMKAIGEAAGMSGDTIKNVTVERMYPNPLWSVPEISV